MTAGKCWCGGATARAEVGEMEIICMESIWHNPMDDGAKAEVKTLYVAGPMSNLPMNNYPMFNSAAKNLRAAGFTVVNPAEFGTEGGASYQDLLRKDLKALLDCDGVAVLEGWWGSVGARNEVQVAGVLKMPVRSVDEWLRRS